MKICLRKELMGENANNKFCDEDIDSNLKRRTHSYGSSSNRSDIIIDDYNFWNK